jgi:hypothetical protein
MPEQHQIDMARRIVVSHAWGVFSTADLLAHYQGVAADPDFDPTFSQLVDLREVTTFSVDSDTLRSKARNPIFHPGVRRAFVGASDLAFGIARMFASYAASASQTIVAFRTIDEAERWLGVDATATRASSRSREHSAAERPGA